MFGARRTVKLLGLMSLLALAGAGLHAAASAQAVDPTKAPRVAGDEILGEWWTENNEGRIRITRDKEGFYRGTTTCCEKDGKATIDVNNPKPELRNRSTLNIVLIWKLKFEDGEYVDGFVYNPRDGKTYRMEMKVIDKETLKIRGYLGISLLGQNQVWKRAHADKSGAFAPPAAAK
jgi:uncharacterized protein (DUF2147 family)